MENPHASPPCYAGIMQNHVFSVEECERCMFCGVNVYDDILYGPFECVDREPMTWRSESGNNKDTPIRRVDRAAD